MRFSAELNDKTFAVRSNVAQFSKIQAARELPEDTCEFPNFLARVVDIFIENTKVPTGAMPSGFISCKGIGPKLLGFAWTEILVLYPGLIYLMTCAAILTLIGIAWTSWNFIRRPQKKCESQFKYHLRHRLSFVLFLLLIPLCFSAMFTARAFRERVVNTSAVNKNGEKTFKNQFPHLLEQYMKIINHVLNINSNELQQHWKDLPLVVTLDASRRFPQSLGNFNVSIIENIGHSTEVTLPLISAMRSETEELLLDFTRFIDYNRFFHCNISSLVMESDNDTQLVINILHDEYTDSPLKLRALLDMHQVIIKIESLIDLAVKLQQLHKMLLDNMDSLQNQLYNYLNYDIHEKVLQYPSISRKLAENIRNLQSEINTTFVLKVPELYYSFVKASYIANYVIIVLVLCALTLGIFIRSKPTPETFGNKLAILFYKLSVSMISSTYVAMSLLVLLFFLLGASMHNFRSNDSAKCSNNVNAYCSLHAKLESNITDYISETPQDVLQAIMHQVHGSISVATASLPSQEQLQELRKIAEFSRQVFKNGRLFEMFRNSLNLEYMYDADERIREYIKSKNTDSLMLRCNSNIMGHYYFDELIKKNIGRSVNALTPNALKLNDQLMISLDVLIEQCAQEIEELKQFYGDTVKNIMTVETNILARECKEQWKLFHIAFNWLPQCMHLKLMHLGTTVGNYKYMEYALHSIWIGICSSLIILCPIMILCMLLTHMQEQKCIVEKRLAGSGVSISEDDDGAHGRDECGSDETDYESSLTTATTPRSDKSNTYESINSYDSNVTNCPILPLLHKAAALLSLHSTVSSDDDLSTSTKLSSTVERTYEAVSHEKGSQAASAENPAEIPQLAQKTFRRRVFVPPSQGARLARVINRVRKEVTDIPSTAKKIKRSYFKGTDTTDVFDSKA